MVRIFRIHKLSCALLILSLFIEIITPSRAMAKDKGAIKTFIDFVSDLEEVRGSFVQIYRSAITGREKRLKGEFYAKIPGRFRWDYTSPENKSMGTDGRKAWILRPDDRVIMIMKDASKFIEKSALAILFGQRRLDEIYDIQVKDKKIILTSKRRDNILRVEITFLPERRILKEVLFVDRQKNTNRFIFREFKKTRGLDDSLFAVPETKGVEVIER